MAQWIKPDINIDFVGQRRKFWTISTLVVVAGLVAMVANVFLRGSALNYGTDFRGGSQIQIEFSKPVTIAQIRGALKSASYKNAEVVKMQAADRTHFFMLRLTEVSSFSAAEQKRAKKAVQDAFPNQLKKFDYREGGDKVYIQFKQSMKIDIAAEQAIKAEARAKAKAAEAKAMGKRPEAKKPEAKKPEAKKPEAKKPSVAPTSAPSSAPAKADEKAPSVAPTSAPSSAPAKKADAKKGPAVSVQLAAILRKAKIEVNQVQLFGRAEDRAFEVSLGGLGADLEKIFDKAFGKGSVKDIPQAESVGAKMGKQLRNDGIKSVLYALLLMLVYIAFRFDFRYAPGAVVALAHDVLITVGLFAITWTEFSLPVVAALLTISGYSINDTIVVYDRIRENVARLRDRKFPLVVNASINETLSRTVLTSLTTLFTTVAIWLMGTGILKTFAFALTAGVLVGTYSSIFIASPLVVLLNERIDAAKRKAGKSTAAR
ncbi:MAG: protein translocase subunit SecF [Proteobacteria bacterium]|nr:MAG: protein translocase subunit SecF [Pseudomonadota bacterium]PIE18450.1 MAG: protein translocase subunit SecF [Pseudomonadota bacterium]